ncbi:stress-response A/B barrel domain-containing protein HS1-like [Sesamum indicum]|uniref:Stress-response A/B barrel domain-containing protein HS1-like n=1 Tax=Sesamum indicum TaxID=4182 RepID=A0A6I9SVB7_SESIN|nr:stress-response A/B barrel domain-containing protein HS1-like [Sesamum indicum]
MEEGKGEVKHMLLAKFKEEVSEQQIEDCIKQYANLVNLIPSMKSFRWGRDVSQENLHQGITHVFESTFESTQGVAEYLSHPDHEAYGNILRPLLEKAITVDYHPTPVQL